eukprot:gene16045-17667_t
MSLFPSWPNLGRLDIVATTNEITLYRGNQAVLTAEKGVSLGLLKLIYGSEANCSGNVIGVKLREGSIQKIITSDATLLDKDEYDLIIQDQFATSNVGGFYSFPPQRQSIAPADQLLAPGNPSFNSNQAITPSIPLTQPAVELFNQFLPNILQQTINSFPPFNTPAAPRTTPQIRDSFNSLHSFPPNILTTSNLPLVNQPSVEKATEDITVNSNFESNVNKDSEPTANQTNTQELHQPIEQDDTVSEGNYIDTAKYPYQCDVCHIPFKSKSKFMHHRRRHTENYPHLCTYCGDSFKHFFELSKHRTELHLCNKSFKCTQCPKSFSTRKELKHHMWRHTGEKMHKCDQCGKKYSSAGNLRLHEQKHKGIKPFKCPLCPKTFLHKTVLENHIRSGHTGQRPFACRFCEKTFPNSSQLSSHLKRHSDSRPYVCEVCGKAFRQGHILKRHSILHTNERPYKCHMCPKTFRESGNLHYHMSTHQSKADRIVLCPFCDKAVILGRGIRRHLRLHHLDQCPTEEHIETLTKSMKPDREKAENHLKSKEIRQQGNLPCPVCEKKCKTIIGLKKHFSSNHPGEELTEEQIQDLPQNCNFVLDSVKCQYCNRCFRSPQRLSNHILITHPDQANESEIKRIGNPKTKRTKNNICEYCGERFFMRATLQSHLEKEHRVDYQNDIESNDLDCARNLSDAKEKVCQVHCNEIRDLNFQEQLVSLGDKMAIDEGLVSSTEDVTTLGENNGSNDPKKEVAGVLSNGTEAVEKHATETDSNAIEKHATETDKDAIEKHASETDKDAKEKHATETVSDHIERKIDEGKSVESRTMEIQRIDGKKSLVPCTLCSRQFSGLKRLDNHMRLRHKEYRTVLIGDVYASGHGNRATRSKCQFCVTSFVYPSALRRHVNKVHAHLQEQSGDDVANERTTVVVEKHFSVNKSKELSICAGRSGDKYKNETGNAQLLGQKKSNKAVRSNVKQDGHSPLKSDGYSLEPDGDSLKPDGNSLKADENSLKSGEDSLKSGGDLLPEGDSPLKSDGYSTVDLLLKSSQDTKLEDRNSQTQPCTTELSDHIEILGNTRLHDVVNDVQNGEDEAESTELHVIRDDNRDSFSKQDNTLPLTNPSFEIISSITEGLTDDESSNSKRGLDRTLKPVPDGAKELSKVVEDRWKLRTEDNNRTTLGIPVIDASSFLKSRSANYQGMSVESFPFVAPHALRKPPPSGYSYAYLPVLVRDNEKNSLVADAASNE